MIERNFRDGVLILDNMYTSTDKEIQNNSEMSALLKEIFRIKKLYGLTLGYTLSLADHYFCFS